MSDLLSIIACIVCDIGLLVIVYMVISIHHTSITSIYILLLYNIYSNYIYIYIYIYIVLEILLLIHGFKYHKINIVHVQIIHVSVRYY